MAAHDNTVLAALDWHGLTCHWPKCYRTAVNETHTHVVDSCNNLDYADPLGNNIAFLCTEHTTELYRHTARRIRRLVRQGGRPACSTCGAPLIVVSDIVRAVKPIKAESEDTSA